MAEPISLRQVLAGSEIFSAIACIDALLEEAAGVGASDIHLDPAEGYVRVRFRIDGQLCDSTRIPAEHHAGVVSRVKVLSGLRTDEHQTAQDGRFRTTVAIGQIDVRVAVSPTYYGERVVLRLLSRTSQHSTLLALGMSDIDRRIVERALTRPHGMILASGPTGSGKTTTLYTLLRMLHTDTVSIVTVEDPIEYAIAGSCQIQVNPRASVSFASGLRSILRQDPNVIMVGEIRDGDTARLATNTALTGHMLLSTIHTNDAATAVLRLVDLGVEEYLVSSTVSLIISQRLVRTLCSNCKVSCAYPFDSLPPIIRTHLASGQELLGSKAVGCGACQESGYKGRTALFEILALTPPVRALVLRRVPAAELTRQAVAEGMRVMAVDGISKISAHTTTPEEVIRVLAE